jgi:hypothetical protein
MLFRFYCNTCDEHLRGLVTRLITLLGEDEAMMFPSRLNIPRIPSDLYDNVKASQAVQITEEIVASPSNVINLVTKPLRCSSQTFSKWSSLLNLGMLLESMLK